MYRSQFTSRTRSIPGVADSVEAAALVAQGTAVLTDVARRAALVVVPTSHVREQVLAVSPTTADRVVVSYHGVHDATRADEPVLPWRERAGSLHVSRLSVPFAGHKNFFWSADFLRACADEVVEIAPLTVIGGGNAGALLRAYAHHHDLGRHLEVVGSASLDEVACRMATARLLLVPSMMEAGSTVLVDAVLRGALPVVAAAGALPELMASLGLERYVVPARVVRRGSVESIEPDLAEAAAIVRAACSDPDRVQADLDTARAVASERYGISNTTDHLVATLRSHGIGGPDL